MSVIEAAPGAKFALARILSGGAAPTCPGRADSALEPMGEAYLGDGSPLLAAALQRRYSALKIKALYTGNPTDGSLQHTIAYDPDTGLSHDARGTFPSTAAAFAEFGAGGDRKVTRDEAATPVQDPDADAYVARHWGPLENGSGSFGDLQAAPPPSVEELDALLSADTRPASAPRALDEALELLEAIWNEHTHPRWPKGTPGLGGKFMRVGQRFMKDGHEWEVGKIAGNVVIAHEASGDVHAAETRVFNTHTVSDVPNVLSGAVPAAPRVLKSGFKSGSKTVIPDENSLVVDADRHEETHDPSIQPHPLSNLTPEQWSHFGLADQLYYNAVMDHFGAWEVNGKKPPPISASGSQWASKLSAIQADAPADARSTFEKEVSSLKGSTSGRQLSGVKAFDGLLNSPEKLAAAQAKYQRFREYEGDVNALIAWDLYNRLGAPDITVIHKAKGSEVFKNALHGKQSILSGLSTSWKTGSWSEPNSFVFALPVRNVGFFETLLGQGWGAGSSESELANIDRLKVGEQAGYYLPHEIASTSYGEGGQASKMFKWIAGQLNKNGMGGGLAGMLKKHFNKDDPYTVDLGPVDANFTLKKAAGAKTYFIPPDNVMAHIEDAMSANPGTPAWSEQKSVIDWPAEVKDANGYVKPGTIITKGGSQEGTRYVVIQNDALEPKEVQYVPLLTGTADYDVNPTGGGYKTNKGKVILGDDGKPLFFPLPPPPQERTWSHDMASLAPGGLPVAVGSMDVGDKVAINNDHWQITKKTGSLVTLQSLSDGSEATVESLWKTQKLEPTGLGAPPPAPAFKPEPGKTALNTLGQVVTVLGVSEDGDKAEVSFAGGKPYTTAAGALSAAPQLPTLTPQKGDTFSSGGVKFTVTNVMKDGTVKAKPLGGNVQAFHLGDAEKASLFRPGDYEPGGKAKLSSMAPGALVNGSSGKKIAPYQVLGPVAGKTYLKNLDTGEVTGVSKNKSYPTLVGKGTAPSAVAHADWKPGDKVDTTDLHPGDKFSFLGGQELTVDGEATQHGELGWQYTAPDGNKGWIPKDLSTSPGGSKATYLGKAEAASAPPTEVVTPGTLPDAIGSGELTPYKWHKGGGGQVYPKLSTLKEGDHFTDKEGNLWKVKQSGTAPIITDGQTLYKAAGNVHVKEAEPAVALPDVTPEVSPPVAAKTPPPHDLTPNTEQLSLANLKLPVGSKMETHGHVWTIQSGGPTTGYTATADDAEITKSFHTFQIPVSYQKAPESAATKPLPSFLNVSTDEIPSYQFEANELAQRADGSLVYRKTSTVEGGWVEVGGHAVDIPNSEEMHPVDVAAPQPAAIQHTGNKIDVHEMQTGQTFFAGNGDPFIVLGHGPAGLHAKSLKSGVVLAAPEGQHGEFELGHWRAGALPTPAEPAPEPLSSAGTQMLQDYEAGKPGTYGAWSVKKTADNGTALYHNNTPVAWKAASGEHYVTNSPEDGPQQKIVNQIKADHASALPVPSHVISEIPTTEPDAKPTGAGTTAGLGIHPATSVVKGHHMKIKTDGKGAEYEVLETPKPGDKTLKVQVLLKSGQPGKVYDWKHYNKQILITKEAPTPAASDLTPNTEGKSISDLGLQPGDLVKDSGNTYKLVGTPGNLHTENVDTGMGGPIHPAFVPTHYQKLSPPTPTHTDANGTTLAPGDTVSIYGTPGFTYQGPDPAEPTKALVSDPNAPDDAPMQVNTANLEKGVPEAPPEPPSAPIPDSKPQTFADMNVGDKYTFPGTNAEYEIIAKDGHDVTVQDQYGSKAKVPPTMTVPKDVQVTYKAPSAGIAPAGQLVGIPQMADMPIQPYLWHKSGTKTYHPLSDLQPGEQFSDKSGTKYTVVSHNVKKLEDPVATTTIAGPSGGTFEVPQQFVNPHGKTIPTRVHKLETTAPVPDPEAIENKANAMNAANDYLDSIGHSWEATKALHDEALANFDSKKYPAGWSPEAKWAQSYADAYVDTYGEDNETIDFGNELFQAVKDSVKSGTPGWTPKTPVKQPGEMTGEEADDVLSAAMTKGHVLGSDANGWIVAKQIGGTYNATAPDGTVHTGLTSNKVYDWMVNGTDPATKKGWADLRLGDVIKTGSGGTAFKITADHGDHWEVTSTKDGSTTDIPKNSSLTFDLVGHEHVAPNASSIAGAFLQGGAPGKWAGDKWGMSSVNGNKVWTYDTGGGEKLAVGYMDPQGGVHITPTAFKPEINDVVTAIKAQHPDYIEAPSHMDLEQDSGFKPTPIKPHQMDVGYVFKNPEGSQFQVTAKHPDGTLDFKKLSGTGAMTGKLNPDTPMTYTLVSKTPPTAEADAIPTPINPEHHDVVNAADKWMLDHIAGSKTANWVHHQALAYKQNNPGVTWGEAYKATTPQSAADADTQGLKDAVDLMHIPTEPIIEKTPPAAPKPAPGGEMPDYSGTHLHMTGSAGGTTGAQFATDPSGKKWLVKTYNGNRDRVATELLANSVYRAMGLKAAEAGTWKQGDQTRLAYPLVDGKTTNWSGKDKAKMEALGQGVMTDALVGNWDFAGLEDDNVLWNGNEPTRIDQGGTFMYRAQGKPKEFGPVPVEVKSLLTGGGQGVKGVSVTESSMRAQAKQIADTLTPEKIDQLVDAAPFKSQQMKQQIRANLKARVHWMSEFADGKYPEMLNGVNLAPEPSVSAPPTPQAASEFNPATMTDEHKTAFSTAQGWLSDHGVTLGTIAKIHGSAIEYHDKGSDWPTAYIHASGDHAAVQLNNNHAQVGSQIKQALQPPAPTPTPEPPTPEPTPQFTAEPTGSPTAPHIEDMPIEPYLWHKGGGGQSYQPIASLKVFDHFHDKKGNEYVVTGHPPGIGITQAKNVKTGALIDVPKSFVNTKTGKIHPTRVLKLTTSAIVEGRIRRPSHGRTTLRDTRRVRTSA